MLARSALLAGLFAAPVALAWLGHRMRDRSPRQKGAFWGGLFGHSAGVVVTLGLALAPPILWTGGSVWRETAVHYAMIVGFAIGAAIGAVRGRATTAAGDAAVQRDAATVQR
jgi:hypothetical protein